MGRTSGRLSIAEFIISDDEQTDKNTQCLFGVRHCCCCNRGKPVFFSLLLLLLLVGFTLCVIAGYLSFSYSFTLSLSLCYLFPCINLSLFSEMSSCSPTLRVSFFFLSVEHTYPLILTSTCLFTFFISDFRLEISDLFAQLPPPLPPLK